MDCKFRTGEPVKLFLLSNSGGIERAVRLVTTKQWELLFTATMLEGVVARRCKLAYVQELHRHDTFRATMQRVPKDAEVDAAGLGTIVAVAAGDGCFDQVVFSVEAFRQIVKGLFEFPRSDTLTVEAFFGLVRRCNMATPMAFSALQNNITSGIRANREEPKFAKTFLVEMMTFDSLVDPTLICEYLQGFTHNSSISTTVHILFGQLLSDPRSQPSADQFYGAILETLQADTRRLKLNDVVQILNPKYTHDAVQSTALVPAIFQLYLEAETAEAGFIPARYARVFVELLQYLPLWNVAVDVHERIKLLTKAVNDLYCMTASSEELWKAVCTIISEPIFGSASASDQGVDMHLLNDKLGHLVHRHFNMQGVVKLLNQWSPLDIAFQDTTCPAFLFWRSLCVQIRHNISQGDPLISLNVLAQLGREQVLDEVVNTSADTEGSPPARDISVSVFYLQVLLHTTLDSAKYCPQVQPLWKSILGPRLSQPFAKAIELLTPRGTSKHPVLKEILDPVFTKQALPMVDQLKNDFKTMHMSQAELRFLAQALQEAPSHDQALRQILQCSLDDVVAAVEQHDNLMASLKELVSISGWLNRFNVADMAEAESEIKKYLEQGADANLHMLDICNTRYLGEFQRGLGDMYAFTIYFRRNQSAIFTSTFQALFGDKDDCEMETIKDTLQHTDEQLYALLAGTLNTNDLVKILPNLQHSDMEEEIRTLMDWERYSAQFTGHSAAQDTRINRCMELLQKMQNVEPVLATFEKYEMVNQTDPDVATVKEIVAKFAEGGRGMPLERVPDNCDKLNDILSGLGPEHFKFIAAVSEADQLVEFLDKTKSGGKDFYSEEGKRKYEEKKKLVDSQIQSSASREHHGRLLNAFDIKAIPLCQSFATMRNKPLREVVHQIAATPMLAAGMEHIESLCQALRDTNANMVVVKSWFTRASLSSFEHAGAMMKQLRESGTVVVELRRLIDKQTQFKICYRLDDTQDEETEMDASMIDELEYEDLWPFCAWNTWLCSWIEATV
jgi:hypothetical protein